MSTRKMTNFQAQNMFPKLAWICARAARAPGVASFPAVELRARGRGLYWFSKATSRPQPLAELVGFLGPLF